jgi:hypothetical protein
MYLGSRPLGGARYILVAIQYMSMLVLQDDAGGGESFLCLISRVINMFKGYHAWLYICNQARVYKSPSRLCIGVAFLDLLGVLFLVVQVDITCGSNLSSPCVSPPPCEPSQV